MTDKGSTIAAGLQSLRGRATRESRLAWRWWSGELLAMLPDALRNALTAKESSLVACVHGESADVSVIDGDTQAELATLDLAAPSELIADNALASIKDALAKTSSSVVELAHDRVLRRTVQLPAAAGERLSNVLGFEMDRLTPFRVDQVYFDFRVAGQDRARRTLDVELTVAPKRDVDRALARLAQIGIEPEAITVANDEDCKPGRFADNVNLLPPAQRAKAADTGNVVRGTLLACAAILAGLVVYLPVQHRASLVRDLDSQIEQFRQAANEAAATRDEIDNTVRQGSFLFARRAQLPTAAELLAEMTRVLPDDTWVARLEANGTQIRVQGESENAAALIGLVEGSALFEDVHFFSPVSKNPRTGNDRFALEAQLKMSGAGS